MTYDPTTPVDNVFNKVEDMMEYGELAQLEYTERQAVAKAYNILLKTGKFDESIRAWNRLPQDPIAHNWMIFVGPPGPRGQNVCAVGRGALRASKRKQLQQNNYHRRPI